MAGVFVFCLLLLLRSCLQSFHSVGWVFEEGHPACKIPLQWFFCIFGGPPTKPQLTANMWCIAVEDTELNNPNQGRHLEGGLEGSADPQELRFFQRNTLNVILARITDANVLHWHNLHNNSVSWKLVHILYDNTIRIGRIASSLLKPHQNCNNNTRTTAGNERLFCVFKPVKICVKSRTPLGNLQTS